MNPPPELARHVIALHHVAIAVRSIEAAAPFYTQVMGMQTLGEPEFVADQQVNVLVVMAGTQRIELVEPASEASPISKFVAKREGLHHLAYEVHDVAAVLADLQARGLRLIDTAPRAGAHGTTIAFLHPSACGGVLTEIVQAPPH